MTPGSQAGHGRTRSREDDPVDRAPDTHALSPLGTPVRSGGLNRGSGVSGLPPRPGGRPGTVLGATDTAVLRDDVVHRW